MNTFSKILIGAAVVIALLNAFSYVEVGGFVLAGAMVVAAVALEWFAKRKPTKPPNADAVAIMQANAWRCARCDTVNAEGRATCQACGAARGAAR